MRFCRCRHRLGRGGLSFGSGYQTTSLVASGQIVLPWHAPLTRFAATLASYYAGIPGGIFAPSLAVGGAIGSNLAPLFGETVSATPVVALCMAGFLAAVTQAPITAAIIVMEMIDGHAMVISLMAVALIAKAVSSRLGPELYQQLATGFHPARPRGAPAAAGYARAQAGCAGSVTAARLDGARRLGR